MHRSVIVYTNIFDFILTNHQFHIETFIKPHIKLFTMRDVLSSILNIFEPVCKWRYICSHVTMSRHAQKIRQLWHSPASDFIKSNNHFHLETLLKLHSIVIKLIVMYNVLSLFNINIYLDCLQKEKHLFTCSHAR